LVDITEGDNILSCASLEIGSPHAANSDRGEIQFLTGCLCAGLGDEHLGGNSKERRGQAGSLQELAAGGLWSVHGG
ncbi:MAG TPA: hypothetical protein P5186_24040, partial [Candidatus Paceibacterota bacterium]|nr:hypothetical protein [Candidatus Paceibacterota bacterium]